VYIYMTHKQQYNYEYLVNFCKEHNVELIHDCSNEKITRDTIVKGKCKGENCNDVFEKKFRQLVISNGFCKKCTEQNRKNKVDITNLKNYGCKNVFQSEVIKNKIKDTNLEKYGDTYALRNLLVKEKQQNTNVEKYGDKCPLKNLLVKEKQQNTNIERYGNKCSAQCPEIKDKIKQSNLDKYGVEYSFQSEKVKNKIKETNLERYGDTCALKNPLINEKRRITNVEKYGVEHTFQSEQVKNKIKETNLYRYGYINATKNNLIKEKIKQTNLKIYGGKSPMCCENVKDKCKKTSLINYGFEYPMQNSEYAEQIFKNSKKTKDYIFPSGRIEKIQGYENFMLDEIIKEHISEDDIIINKKYVPIIIYKDDKGVQHRYYVDCYIKSQNKCIEVKSTWTIKIKEDNVFLKQQAVKDAGYKCEIWVYNRNGEKVECLK